MNNKSLSNVTSKAFGLIACLAGFTAKSVAAPVSFLPKLPIHLNLEQLKTYKETDTYEVVYSLPQVKQVSAKDTRTLTVVTTYPEPSLIDSFHVNTNGKAKATQQVKFKEIRKEFYIASDRSSNSTNNTTTTNNSSNNLGTELGYIIFYPNGEMKSFHASHELFTLPLLMYGQVENLPKYEIEKGYFNDKAKRPLVDTVILADNKLHAGLANSIAVQRSWEVVFQLEDDRQDNKVIKWNALGWSSGTKKSFYSYVTSYVSSKGADFKIDTSAFSSRNGELTLDQDNKISKSFVELTHYVKGYKSNPEEEELEADATKKAQSQGWLGWVGSGASAVATYAWDSAAAALTQKAILSRLDFKKISSTATAFQKDDSKEKEEKED